MSLKFNNLSSSLLALSVLTFGCVTFAPQATLAQVNQEVSDGVVVNIADKNLSKNVTVDRAKLAKVGPVTRVQVSIQNLGNRPLQVQYRAQWMTEEGFEIPTNDRWEPATIDANTSRSIDLLGNARDIASVVVNVKKQ